MSSTTPIYTRSDLYTMIRTELFAGTRPARADHVGLELEMIPYRRVGLGPARQLMLRGEGVSMEALFNRLAALHGWRRMAEEGGFVLDVPGGGHITLEPAGQIEYSGPPFDTTGAALEDLTATYRIIEEECAAMGIALLLRGYNNVCTEDDLQLLMRKPRYVAMDHHFSRIGSFGRRMMRATAALQINLDFGPSVNAGERWRLANMMAPSLNAIFANAPHLHEGRHYRSFRYEIWRRADPTRTGRLLDSPDLDPVDDYLRFALDATVMMIGGKDGEMTVGDGRLTFGSWLAGDEHHGYPDWDDWRLHLSTLFPDVRPRGWMELRSIDLLPREWWAVPVAMTTALLYNDTARREALTRLERRLRRTVAQEHEHGGYWHADYITGVELLELAIPLIADAGLAEQAAEFHDRYCRNGLTPAEAYPIARSLMWARK